MTEPSAKNFTQDELRCHCPACRTSLPTKVMQWALDKLQAIRDELGFPLPVNSAFRCAAHPAENRKLKPGTHNRGIAFDIAVPWGPQRMKLIEVALKHGARGFGFADSYVHIDFRDGPLTCWTY